MGTKHALPASTAHMPTQAEGLGHGTGLDFATSTIQRIYIDVRYWDNEVDLGKDNFSVTRAGVEKRGGSEAEWLALVAKATDGSGTDDLIESMVGCSWGCEILWACMYGLLAK